MPRFENQAEELNLFSSGKQSWWVKWTGGRAGSFWVKPTEENFAAVTSALGIMQFDTNNVVVAVNQKILSMLGASREACVGKAREDVLSAPSVSGLDPRTLNVEMASGRATSDEYRVRDADRDRAILRVDYVPLRDRSGRHVGTIGLSKDVTEAKVRETHLQRKLEAVSRMQIVATWSADRHLLEANDNFLKLFKLSRSEALGRHHNKFQSTDPLVLRRCEER